MKRFNLIFLFLLFCISNSFTQELNLPAVSTLKTEADLDRTKGDLIRAADWLEATSLNVKKEQRREVERFVFMWISASKKVNVEMNEKILSLDSKNPGLVMIYTAAAAKSILLDSTRKKGTAQLAGLTTVARYYKAGRALAKDKLLDALVKAQKRGKLNEWVKE